MRSLEVGVWELGGCKSNDGQACEGNREPGLLKDVWVLLVMKVWFKVDLELIAPVEGCLVHHYHNHAQGQDGPWSIKVLVIVEVNQSMM